MSNYELDMEDFYALKSIKMCYVVKIVKIHNKYIKIIFMK